MLNFGRKPIYLCRGKTDMRKSINGLTELVRSSFDMDPFSDAIFVFCNKTRNRIKILEWDSDGFWLYFKRLERGRLSWPGAERSETIILNDSELGHLIGSAKLEKKLRGKELPKKMII